MIKEIFLLLFLAIVISACSSEKAPQSGPAGSMAPGQGASGQTPAGPATSTGSGEYSIVLKPEDAYTNTSLYLAINGSGAADAKIEWLINGEMLYPGETSPQLKAGIAKKGFTVQAKATIKGKEVRSNIVKIKNAPPVITRVKLVPEVFKTGDRLGAEVSGSDPDGDEVTFLIEWTKNGEPAGKGMTIDSPLKKGDKVTVKITPFDGEDYGRSGTLSNEIRNMPPMIVDDKNFRFDGNVVSHQIKAIDPDGDPITYSLKNAPQGMTIDASTGLITWTVPAGFKEKGSYTAVAKDPKGGESTQVFNFDLSH
jgi:predicted RNA-binding protein with TRAM domain